MRSFVLFYFVLLCICNVITLVEILGSTYPREKKVTFATDMVGLNLNLLLAIWAYLLLWGPLS